jgi:hypothetical protein
VLDCCYNCYNHYNHRLRSNKTAAVPPEPHLQLMDGVWRLAVSYSDIASYRNYHKRQRIVTFQPYVPHGALHLRDSADDGVSVKGGVPSITVEILDNASLAVVAEVRLCCSTRHQSAAFVVPVRACLLRGRSNGSCCCYCTLLLQLLLLLLVLITQTAAVTAATLLVCVLQELIQFLDCVNDPQQLLFYAEKARDNHKQAPARVS